MQDDSAEIYAQLKHTLGDVVLLAVSKHQPIEKIHRLYQLGQRLFAENYVQEAVEKIEAIQLDGLVWHYIGHIQSNKTKLIAQHFDWVQSIDRFKIAQRLNHHCRELDKIIQVCINVNIDDEAQKGGVAVGDVAALAKQIQPLSHLKLRGVMVIPKPQPHYQQQLATFKQVRRLFDGLNEELGLGMDTVSMGMSGDYKAAQAAGATMCRIGTLLFGGRDSSGEHEYR